MPVTSTKSKSPRRKSSRKRLLATKGFPAHRFTGKVKFAEDPVAYQRKLRDDGE